MPTRGLPPTLNSYNGLQDLIEPVSQAQMEVIREKVQGLLTSCGEYAELLGAIRDQSEQSHDTDEQALTTFQREWCNVKAREQLSAVESVSAASEWFLRTLDERERAETSARSSAAAGAGRSMPPSAPGDAETTTALGPRDAESWTDKRSEVASIRAACSAIVENAPAELRAHRSIGSRNKEAGAATQKGAKAFERSPPSSREVGGDQSCG